MKTAADVIAAARIPLNDRVAPHRHHDEDMLLYLRTSYDALRRLRPDLFVGRFIVDRDKPLALDSDLEWLPLSYLQQLSDGVAGRCALVDNDLAGDGGKAAELIQLATMK